MNWRSVLGHREGNTRNDVRRKFRTLAKAHHTDKLQQRGVTQGDPELIKNIIAAYREAEAYFASSQKSKRPFQYNNKPPEPKRQRRQAPAPPPPPPPPSAPPRPPPPMPMRRPVPTTSSSDEEVQAFIEDLKKRAWSHSRFGPMPEAVASPIWLRYQDQQAEARRSYQRPSDVYPVSSGAGYVAGLRAPRSPSGPSGPTPAAAAASRAAAASLYRGTARRFDASTDEYVRVRPGLRRRS